MPHRPQHDPSVTAAFEEGQEPSTLNTTRDAASIKESDPRLRNSPPPDGDEPVKLPAGLKYESELGRGGMGVVYLAKDEVLNRQVAVKVILHSQFASSGDLQRFRAEASMLAKLQHPNIVQVYTGGEFLKCPYLVLEYVTDGTLAARLKKEKVSLPVALDLIEKIARGVQAAHEEGIIHRDLKPQNILLGKPRNDQSWSTAWGTPKVADFGLAKLFTSEDTQQTASQAVMGTPAYMSPEQAAGMTRDVTVAADIYSLGGILYTLLTNKPPFEGTSAVDVLGKVQKSMPIKPSRIEPSVPAEIEAICLKCLAKDPLKRYASAMELAEVLHEYREKHQLISGSKKITQPAPAGPRSSAWAKGSLLAASIVAVSLLGWWLFHQRPSEIVQTHATTPVATEVSPPVEKLYPTLPDGMIKELERLECRINQNSFRIPLDNGHEVRLFTTGPDTTKLEKIQYIARPDQTVEFTFNLNTKLETLTTVIDRHEHRQLLISKEVDNVQLIHVSIGKTVSEGSTAKLTLQLPWAPGEKGTLVGGVQGAFQLLEKSPALPINVEGDELRRLTQGEYHVGFIAAKPPRFDIQRLQFILTPDFLKRSWLGPVQSGKTLPDIPVEDNLITKGLGYKELRVTDIRFNDTVSNVYFKPPMTAAFDGNTRITLNLRKQKQKEVWVDDTTPVKNEKAFGGLPVLPRKIRKLEWVQDEPLTMTFDVSLKLNANFDATVPDGNYPKVIMIRSEIEKFEVKSPDKNQLNKAMAGVLEAYIKTQFKNLAVIEYKMTSSDTQPLAAKLHNVTFEFSQVGVNNIIEARMNLILGE